MPVKSFRDIATSLSGSSFRRLAFDGRTRMLREVPTLGQLNRRRTPPLRSTCDRTSPAR